MQDQSHFAVIAPCHAQMALLLAKDGRNDFQSCNVFRGWSVHDERCQR
jgi:hypothetical protein